VVLKRRRKPPVPVAQLPDPTKPQPPKPLR